MRIMLCSFHPVFTGTGGAEKVFWSMADHFASIGDEVLCLGFERKADPLAPTFHPHGALVKVANPGRYYRKSPLIQLASALVFFNSGWRRRLRDSLEGRRKGRLIMEAADGFKPDAIVAFQPEMTYVLRHSIKTDVPIATALHCDIDTLLKGKERLFPALESSEAIVVLQRSYLSDLARYVDASKAVFIPNAIQRQNGCCDQDSRVIAMAGRVCPQKNQLLAIRAFAIFSKGHPGWKLRIFGDCSYDKGYYEQCMGEACTLKVEDHVEFMGVTQKMRGELLKCSIFAFPSIFEGFSLALAEAMALGMPCACLKTCTGLADMVENGRNGMLSEPTPEAYSKVLSTLADDPAMRSQIGGEARKSMEEYSPERIWGKWDDLILRIASGVGGHGSV